MATRYRFALHIGQVAAVVQSITLVEQQVRGPRVNVRPLWHLPARTVVVAVPHAIRVGRVRDVMAPVQHARVRLQIKSQQSS